MNLQDLIDRLDWGVADEGQIEWAKTHTTINLDLEDGRTRLVFEALLEFHKDGPLTEDERSSQQAKRWLLSQVGIWRQIITLLNEGGLLETSAYAEPRDRGKDGNGKDLGADRNTGYRPAPVDEGNGNGKGKRHRRSRHKRRKHGNGSTVERNRGQRRE